MMTADEMLDQALSRGENDRILTALFYARPDFALLPFAVTGVEQEGSGNVLLHLSDQWGRTGQDLSLTREAVRERLRISPEKLLSHPEHLLVTQIREKDQYGYAMTYDRSQNRQRYHLESLFAEFVRFTGISTMEELSREEAQGMKNLEKADRDREALLKQGPPKP